MSEKLKFIPFTPEEGATLDNGEVVTRNTVNGWAAYYVPKEVGRHICACVFGETEEKAREAVPKSGTEKPLPGIRADGSHFH